MNLFAVVGLIITWNIQNLFDRINVIELGLSFRFIGIHKICSLGLSFRYLYGVFAAAVFRDV